MWKGDRFGNLVYRQGEVEEARRLYERALEHDPVQPEARYNLANTLEDLGEIELAVAELRKVCAAAPDFADAHYNLGLMLAELGGTAQARQHLQRYLELDAQSDWAHHARSYLEQAARLNWTTALTPAANANAWATPNWAGKPDDAVVMQRPGGASAATEKAYTVEWRVTNVGSGPTYCLRDIQVRVSWSEEESSVNKAVTLGTRRYNQGDDNC